MSESEFIVREPEIGSVIGVEELDAIRVALDQRGRSLSWGDEVAAFEADFAAYSGVEHAIAVSSCTAALDLCAQVLQLAPGDEVIATPQSFWATIRGPAARGVTIRFADIEPDTLNLDPATIEPLITPRTRAIYVVHYGGNPADLAALRDIADRHRLPIVEDCAHAPGARHQGRVIGSGDLCCFSFQSYKNMTTLGEGGMITTRNSSWAKDLRALRTLGVTGEYRRRQSRALGPYRRPSFTLTDHSFGSWDYDLVRLGQQGPNCRMAAVPAAVGRVQLRKLDALNTARRAVARRYDVALSMLTGVRGVRVREGDLSSCHLYTCFLTPDAHVDRNELLRFMQVECKVRMVMRYWPLHLSAVMRAAGHSLGECPVCERVWFEQQINLPIGPLFEEATTTAVIDSLREGMRRCQKQE